MMNNLPKNIIFILHGETEEIFVNELFYGFVEFVFDKFGFNYYKLSKEHPVKHIGKDFDNIIYHSFHNFHIKPKESIEKVLKDLKDEDPKNLDEEFCVIFILDEDRNDDKNLINKIKEEKIYADIAKEIIEEKEAKFHSAHLFTVRHSFEEIFSDYHTSGIKGKNKKAKAMKYLRNKRSNLSNMEDPEEYIKKLKINKEKTNIEDLFTIFLEWMKNLER